MGGYFLSHPPGTPTATVDVEDLTNRSTAHLPARWERTDEWYNYRSPDFADPDVPDGDYSPREGGVHVLATMDETTYDEQDGNETDDDHPIAWCHPYDGGRSWYTGMGHTAASYSEPDFVEHLLGGIEITAGAASSAECTNEGPSVQAAADPQTGNAPLTVSFSSSGSDPEGQTLVYSWDFGDGGRAFGQNADPHLPRGRHLHGQGHGDRPGRLDRHRRGRGHRGRPAEPAADRAGRGRPGLG